ncbi:hypothetical protein MRX96_047768 [Rhipicephalus microplus]
MEPKHARRLSLQRVVAFGHLPYLESPSSPPLDACQCATKDESSGKEEEWKRRPQRAAFPSELVEHEAGLGPRVRPLLGGIEGSAVVTSVIQGPIGRGPCYGNEPPPQIPPALPRPPCVPSRVPGNPQESSVRARWHRLRRMRAAVSSRAFPPLFSGL